MSKVFAYTITRANSTDRCRLLLETLTRGRATADAEFYWHVYVNGKDISGKGMVEAAHAGGIINSFEVAPHNEGQHPPTNRAIETAIKDSYDYIIRIDDDVEWLTKRWLAKLVEASQKLRDEFILSPLVRGLRWQPDQSQQIEIEGIPVRIIEGPIGGICRLIPVALLKKKPYVSDVRLPMGGGDAVGIGRWAMNVVPIIPMAYCQHIRIRHAKSTDKQEMDDPQHFDNHAMFQNMPYIPPWVPA